MRPDPMIQSTVESHIVDLLVEIPRVWPAGQSRLSMWEMIEVRITMCARSTRTPGEWWSKLVKRLNLNRSLLAASSTSSVIRQIDSWRDERKTEFWRLLRQEPTVLAGLARVRHEERKEMADVRS